jgi:exopolysaccharide biosynthesis polyprenyl glycosylphosphotransferase
MLWRSTTDQRIAQLADALTTLLSFVAAYGVWHLLKKQFPSLPIGAEINLDSTHFVIVVASLIVWFIGFNAQKAYSYQRFTSFATEAKIVLRTVLVGVFILFGVVFLLRPEYIPRTLLLLFAIVNFIFLTLEKLLLFYAARIIRQGGRNRKTVLVVGTGEQTKRFVEVIEQNFSWGLDIVGFLDAQEENVGKEVFGRKILGTYHGIASVLHSKPFDGVIITLSTKQFGEIRDVLDVCEQEGVQVRIVSDFLGKIAKRFRADVVYGLPIISIVPIPHDEWRLFIKRVVDIVGSLIGLILLAPFFLIIAVAVKLSSPGPVVYKWEVFGFNKKPFKSWKFRTMVANADTLKKQLMPLNEMDGPVFKIREDPRITKVGKFLRKHSLDELPQLWSVLKGDMSLVGPRPAGQDELSRYESWHRRRLSIKPGMTCVWQVSGRNEISKFDDWVKMDLEYIDNWSLWLDFKILGKTVSAVFSGKGAR